MIIGIDPGITGGIAYLDGDPGDHGPGEAWEDYYWDSAHMPIMAKSGGKGNQIDPYALHELLTKFPHRPIRMAYVEKVNAMPKQGVTSVFSFGKSAGIIEGVLAALQIPVTLVTPQKWKKRAGLYGKDKDAARTMAIQLYPMLASHMKRKCDIGIADAILIAHFGRDASTT